MPEGDTIHHAARTVGAALVGEAVVEVVLPRLAERPPAPGTLITDVEARGKHLLVHFGDGHVLHTHLRMSGAWHVQPRTATRPRGRAVVVVEDAVAVCARAPVVELLDRAALRRHPALRRLGPDLAVPGVDIDAAVERLGRLVARGTTLGDALLDQRPACGIGNVIMQEACFLEGIDPRTPIERVDGSTRRALYATAARLLQANVDTISRTTVPDARPGTLWVYDRTRRPCRRCGTAVQGGRSGRDARATWWCPSCQQRR